MTSGRAFQAAVRCASLFRSAGRLGGFAAFDNISRSCVRVAGVLNAPAWTAPTALALQRLNVAQPVFGFAAQAACPAVEGGDANSCTVGSGSGSSSPSALSSDDSECLPSGDGEGVIPRRPFGASRDPPWVAPSSSSSSQHQQPQPHHQQYRHPGESLKELSCNAQPRTAAAATQGPAVAYSTCTGVTWLAAAVIPGSLGRMYGTRAANAAAVAEAAKPLTDDADSAAATAGPPSYPHPSRPRHVTPAPHRHQGEDAMVGPEEGTQVLETRLSGADYRERHSIRVDDPACPEPFQAFEDAPFPKALMDVLHAARYGAPSTIQAQAWPIALSGRNLVAIASTGSGKTLGYLLPALLHIQARGGDPALGPSALVLAPTRELAKQIEAEALRFARVIIQQDTGRDSRHGRQQPRLRRDRDRDRRGDDDGRLRTVCLYGGASRGGQQAQLWRRPHLVIATPGRLLDFVESGDINLGQVSYVVLDEADRMLDMGFEPQIADITRELPPGRQTLFFSATWPGDVRQAAARFSGQQPVHVFIGGVQDKAVAATTIRQRVEVLDGRDKLAVLEAYLREKLLEEARGDEGGEEDEGQLEQQHQQEEEEDKRDRSDRRQGGRRWDDRRDGGSSTSSRRLRRAIVFCKTKAGCDHLAYRINSMMPFQAASLHGDKTQAARDYALQQFRSGRVPVLVATDVAARGLDIPNVTAVVNFDMPEEIEMYVHRIGRTGRAGASGDSMALVSRQDGGVAAALVGVLEGAGQEVPEELRQMAASSQGGARGGFRGRGHRGGGGGFRGRERRDHRRWDREEGGRYDDEGGRRSEWEGEEPRRHRHHHADDWRSGEAGSRKAHGRGW